MDAYFQTTFSNTLQVTMALHSVITLKWGVVFAMVISIYKYGKQKRIEYDAVVAWSMSPRTDKTQSRARQLASFWEYNV